MSLLDPKLQAFVEIVRHQTVHGAARTLKMTQTGVTQRIRALESQLGVTLFLRSRRGMTLTPEGVTLHRYCVVAIDLEGQVSRSIIKLILTGPTSIMTSRVVKACSDIYKTFPKLHLCFEIDDSNQRVGLLKRGLVQLAIISPEDVTHEMNSKVLKPDCYVLVASPKWRQRKLYEIIENERMIDFYPSDQTTIQYLKKFKLSPTLNHERLYANNNEMIMSLFSNGVGYGTLTHEVALPYLHRGDIIILNGKNTLEIPQALAWYPRAEMPDYFKALIKVIK